MKVLITGGSGVIGWSLLNKLTPHHEVWYTYFANDVVHPTATGRCLDIRDQATVQEVINKIDPDVIVHSAAITDVDKCEVNPELAHSVNVRGTKNILRTAESIGAFVVFLSTSFVFDGKQNRYHPDDDRNPINEYGQTKYDAERAVEAANVDIAILRTGKAYGNIEAWQSETMIQWTLNQLSNNGPVEVFEDWHNNPTYLLDILNVIEKIISKQSTGIFHAVGSEYINRYSWAKYIAAEFDYDASRIVPVQSESTNLPAKRPNANLDNSSVTSGLSVSMTDIDTGTKAVSNSL